MKNDEELGLYNEPFDNPMIKKDEVNLKEIAEKLQDRELFPESNQRAKEIIKNSDWDVTLMDGLEDEEPFFTEEEIEKILQEEPTEDEELRNFSIITSETENISEEEIKEEPTTIVSNKKSTTIEQHKKNGYKVNQYIEDNSRMDIIGQNGNEGLHYDNEEDTSLEKNDEKKN